MSSEGATPDPVEVEWQLDAADLGPVELWLAALPERATDHPELPMLTVRAKPPRRLVDRYFDTDDWRVGRAGFVLRTRQQGRREEATLKDSRPASESGLRRRLELTEDLPPGGLPDLGDDGPVGHRVTAMAGTRPLRQVLEVRTRRRPFALRSVTGEVAEVVLDDTLILVEAGRPPAHLLRVEVEVVPEWAGRLEPLVADLCQGAGLTPATHSKFEAGLLAAGLVIPGPPDLGPSDVGRDASVGDLAYAALRTHLAALLVHEPGTRLGEDPESLHDMRVATRRLRAALDLFTEALPPRAATLRQELKWVADALGAVRDLDVQLQRTAELTAWAEASTEGPVLPLDSLRALLEQEREAARRELLTALDSVRWERAVAALTTLAIRQAASTSAMAPALARAPAASVVGDLVSARHRSAAKAAERARRSGLPEDYHRLRIRCKRLRYSLELTTAVYGAPARRFTRTLVSLQDALGDLQDDEVASARLLALATGAPPPPAAAAGATGLPPATVFAMGGIAERYRLDSVERRRGMPERLRTLDGKSWQRLAGVIERRRATALAASAPRTLGPTDSRSIPPEVDAG